MSKTGAQSQPSVRARLDGQTYEISIEKENGAFRVHVGDKCYRVHRQELGDRGLTSLLINNRPYEAEVERHPAGFSVTICGVPHTVEILDPAAALAKRAARSVTGPGIETVVAPMPGIVVSVEVDVGHRVEAGTPLIVVEAMKMQNELAATYPGVVRQVKAQPGQRVDTKEVLLVLERA